MNAINFWAWDPHAPPIGWFAVNLAIFLAGLLAVTLRPLRGAFAQRHRNIKEAIGAAASEHARAMSEQRLWRDRLAGIDAEVRGLAVRSATEGERERQAMVAEAQAYVANLTRDTSAQAAQLEQQAKHRLHGGLLDAAVQQATADLQARLGEGERARLADAAIAELQAAAGAPRAPQVRR